MGNFRLVNANQLLAFERYTDRVQDTVVVLFEVTPSGNVQIAGDDDSGEDRNALIEMRLTAGRSYQTGVRLYHADRPDQTSVMAW